jgi:protein-tyrosine phosphatase
MVRVLFVCLGNICRSPSAEGVFRALVEREGLAGCIEADSAGTHDYHIGAPPDGRAQEAACRRGIDISELRGRKVTAADFRHFDYVLAMDRSNHRHLQRLCPKGEERRLRLFLDFAPDLGLTDVPDPYYGGEQGFEAVLDLIEAGARGLLRHIRDHHPEVAAVSAGDTVSRAGC